MSDDIERDTLGRPKAKGQRALLQSFGTDPETLAKSKQPGFVAFASERLVGWLVDPITGCWHWTGRRQKKGGLYVTWNGKKVSAPVAVWITQGRRPPAFGEILVRTCDSVDCVNPAHRVCAPRGSNAAVILAIRERDGEHALNAFPPAPPEAAEVERSIVDALAQYDAGRPLCDRNLANAVSRHRTPILRALRAYTITTEVLS